MALFGGKKKNLLQTIKTSGWRNDDERLQVVEELKESTLKISEAVPLLIHKDTAIRQIAIDQVRNDPTQDTAKRIVELMSDQASHVRSALTRLIAKMPEEVIEATIEAQLQEQSTQRKRLGWEIALALTGPIGAKYLQKACTSAPAAVRATAVQRLLNEKDANEIIDLLLDLSAGEDARIRNLALDALLKVQDERVADLMVDSFAHGDATMREKAGGYLRAAAEKDPEGMRTKMLELLSEGEDATRRLSVEILLATGSNEDVLTAILMFAKDLVGWLRQRILETLQTFGDEILRPAVNLLSHEDDELRTAALVLAEHFNDPRLVAPVCKMLEDDDWWLRITACDTLGRLADERSVDALVKALDDSDTRWAAIGALAKIGSPKSYRPLTQLLKDERPEVRLEVLGVFSGVPDKRLIGLLQAVQERDKSSEVRTRAAEVLRDLREALEMEARDMEAGTMSVASSSLKRPIDRVLARIREDGASDMHISVDEPPLVRKVGVLTRLEDIPALGAKQTDAAVRSVLTERQAKLLDDEGQVDFCYAIPEVGRYRANAFRQRLGTAATFRVIPNMPPTFAELRLPGRLTELLDYHQGIIVVSGPASSGKSTTLAAIINLINETKPDHVITLEDPIEFVHPVKTALVNQREVGTHTASFARALRGALRQDPDVIMVGELRDTETTRMALEAAETGHLVVATLHTTSAVETVDRLVGSFPPEEQAQVRMGLSEALKYVVCQSLVPRKDGNGRVAVFEVLKGTMNVGNLIRDNKTLQLHSLMQIGRRVGMQTVDMALEDLVEAGLISAETAWLRAQNPTTFEPMCDPDFIKESQY